MSGAREEDDYQVRAVVRAAELLQLIRQASGEATLGWLSTASGLSKPTVFRLVRTLMHVGLVETVPHRNAYRLGVQCVVLGQSYLENVDILREARSTLAELRDETTETVHLGVLDTDGRVVYLEKLEGHHAVGVMKSRVGRAVPAHCTGIGKMLLACLLPDLPAATPPDGEFERFTSATITNPEELSTELERISSRGYSLDLGEHEDGVQCVAVPILDGTGMAVAALSVTGPANRLPLDRLEHDLLASARVAATTISRRLGYVGS
jgi:IclR family KDG regulon transcriptional repressor